MKKPFSQIERKLRCAKGEENFKQSAPNFVSSDPNFTMKEKSKLKFSINDQLKQIDVA